MEHFTFLQDLVIIYGLGALVVYLFQKLGQSPVVGFLVTGLLLGPNSFSLIDDPHTVEILAEVGVMLLLFSLGLELSLEKLAKMKRFVFGAGMFQVAVTIGLVVVASYPLGLDWKTALFFGFVLSLSSTAIVLKLLLERKEMDAVYARVSLGVLIFQDLCIAGMIVVIPMLATEGAILLPLVIALAKAAVVICVILMAARYLLPPILDGIARSRSKELFITTAFFLFLGTAWATSLAGFSLALGSFLAGLMISESPYSHQVFSDVRPLRDSLNSLFFISIGMLVAPDLILQSAASLGGLVAAIVVGKALIVLVAVLVFGLPFPVAVLSGLALAQIGEFSFILLEAGSEAGLLTTAQYQLLLSSAVVTMLLTPLLFWSSHKLVASGILTRGLTLASDVPEPDEISPADHVIICGFGVGGQNVARVLARNEIDYLILELNAALVKDHSQRGEPILFGDCTDPAILEHAGIHTARGLILSISDPFSTERALKTIRVLEPELPVLVRTKYLAEIDHLYELGATEVVTEEFEASLELITRILRLYHVPRQVVASHVKEIRDERYSFFREEAVTVPRIRLGAELDVYVETIEIPSTSSAKGQTISELALRNRTGALILGIVRDDESINNPEPDDFIEEGDLVVLSGTKEQLKAAVEMLEA